MKDPHNRWKATGVAVGAAALMTAAPTGSAQASVPAAHLTPQTSSWSVLHELAFARTAQQQLQLQVAEERYLGYLGRAVASLEAKAAALGTPGTLTPRQAAKLRAVVAAASHVQRRLAALSAAGAGTLTGADLAKASALQARAAAVASQVRTALANASIVRPADPDKVNVVNASLTRAALTDADRDGRLCDGDHDGARTASWDGHRSFRSGSFSDHHRFAGFRR